MPRLQVRRVRREQSEVVRVIVLLVAVLVMHHFALAERSADLGFHHDHVLSHVSVAVGTRMAASVDESVAVLDDERFPLEISAALLRAEARTVISPGPNDHRLSAVSASGWPCANAALHIAVVIRDGSNVAGRTTQRLAASSAVDVGLSGMCPLLACGIRQFSSRVLADLSIGKRRDVASLVAVNAAELESARWEVHRPPAPSTLSSHERILTSVVGSWKQRDMGHFELVV